MTDTKLPPPPDEFEIVAGDSIKRLQPHSAICVNSNVVWLVSQAFRSRMAAEKYRAELAALRAENERLRKALDDANAGEKS